MKTNKLMAIAILVLMLLSCKSEAPKEAWGKMKFPVSLSIDRGGSGALRATETGKTISASYPNERKIENLTVVVFTHNNTTNVPIAVEKVISYDELTKPTGNDPYQGNYQFDMKMAGTYQLEVIANGYKDDTDKAAFIGKFPVGMSYEQFKKVVFERALPNHGENGFAMLSTEPVTVKTQKGQPAQAGQIKLRRLACRFDVFNKLVDELKLTKVTLQNQTVKSYMMTQVAVPTGADGGAKEYIQTANGTWFTPTVVSGGIYSYENPTKGAVKLQLEGTYNNQAWQKTIELLDKNGSPVATQRNHIYRVHLTKGNGTTPDGGDEKDKDKITYNIEVLDWNEDNTFDYSDNDVWDAEQRINPLQYVAEYNINKAGNGFVTDKYATNVSGYYSWPISLSKFSNITIEGKAYHLPSVDEWGSIVPESSGGVPVVSFNKTFDKNLSIPVSVAGKSVTCNQDFKGIGDNVCYALRFKNTEYQSAWKYEWVKEGGYQVLKITSRNVTDRVTIDEVATKAFWQQNSADDIVRVFPASGHNASGVSYSATPSTGEGASCVFGSYTHGRSQNTFMMGFTSKGAGVSESPDCAKVIRLFKGTGRSIFTQVQFTSDKITFPSGGGTGRVTGSMTLYVGTDASGKQLTKVDLNSDDYTLSLKSGKSAQISINDRDKSFTVKAGTTAEIFRLLATAKYVSANPGEIVVRRQAPPTPPAPTPTINPLDYVAKGDLNPQRNGFASFLSTSSCGYFSYDGYSYSFRNMKIDGINYHLPSDKEWMGIVPLKTHLYFTENRSYSFKETVSVGGKIVECDQDFRVDGYVIYALRYKGTEYQSAWRYEYSQQYGVMTITSRNVAGVTLSDIAKKDFWSSNTSKDVTRFFPASGYNKTGSGSSPISYRGQSGFFLSRSTDANGNSYYMAFGWNPDSRYWHPSGYGSKSVGLSVRLFKDTL